MRQRGRAYNLQRTVHDWMHFCTDASPLVTAAVAEMFDEADESVASRPTIAITTHSQYNLRTNVHNKELVTKISQLNEGDFLVRMLYKNCYRTSICTGQFYVYF